MSKAHKTEFKVVDGILMIDETQRSQVKETSMVFLAIYETDLNDPERAHLVYKLTKAAYPDQYFFWASLWNSVCLMGVKKKKSNQYHYKFDSVSQSISEIMSKEEKVLVCKTSFKEYVCSINNLKNLNWVSSITID